MLKTFAVQDDFGDERVVRDHHRYGAKAGLVAKLKQNETRPAKCFSLIDVNCLCMVQLVTTLGFAQRNCEGVA